MKGTYMGWLLFPFVVVIVCVCFYLGRKKKSILYYAIIGLCFAICIDYTGVHNYKFYCTKSINSCSYYEKNKMDTDFKKVGDLILSDIKYVNTEDIKSSTKRRRGGAKAKAKVTRIVAKTIVFKLKDGTVKNFNSFIIPKDTKKSIDIVNSINEFLHNNEEFYLYETNKSNKPDFFLYFMVVFWTCFFLGMYKLFTTKKK